jgi:enoyl-CoA hydratase/carnithine racemase
MSLILFEKKGKIGFITLNNPKQRNALSLDLMNEMKEKLDTISENKDISVVIIRGNGPSFCAGHDINELIGKDYDHFKNIFSTCSSLMLTIRDMPQVVIAQVHGAALAAGCQLVAACDLAIAESKSKFSTPGLKIGLFCSTPMIPLSRLIGRRNALDMLFTARFISAQEAEKFGLVNKVIDSKNLSYETEKLANDISKFSSFIIGYGKKAFYRQIELDERSAYEYAKEVMAQNCLFIDAQEGMNAFLEKCKPEWKNC